MIIEQFSFKGSNEVVFRLLSYPKDLYAYFDDPSPEVDDDDEEISPFANLRRMRVRAVRSKIEWKYSDKKVEGNGIICSLRKVVYIFNEGTKKVEIYMMPTTVWGPIESFLKEEYGLEYKKECSPENISHAFRVEKSGVGKNTRYKVLYASSSSFIDHNILHIMDELFRKHDIIDIIKKNKEVEVKNLEVRKLNRFDIMDFDFD